jgi:glycosyltransferase involved in cell wall biosynthesis
MRYAETLAARGDEVEVFALQKNNLPDEETIAGVKVFRLQRRSFEEKKPLSFLNGVARFCLRSTWQISKRHLHRPYDILHINSIPDFVVFVAALPKLMGVPVILDIHDIMPELYASKFGGSTRSFGFKMMLWLERISAGFANHVIIANHLWQERLWSRGVALGKCTVLLNYPDRAIFQSAPRPSSEKFVMLYPGTLNQHQGLDVAIRAFSRVAKASPHTFFHIHGEGRSRGKLAELVKELGLEDRVLFKPMLPIRQIAAVMNQSDLAVVPKRRDSFGNEAFSTKILEFMSSGVPVLVSNTKIDQYYFNDSVVKFFEDGNEEDLATKMLAIMRDQAGAKAMAERALEFVRPFDWEVNKQVYLDLVDSLVDPRVKKRSDTVLQPSGQSTHAEQS